MGMSVDAAFLLRCIHSHCGKRKDASTSSSTGIVLPAATRSSNDLRSIVLVEHVNDNASCLVATSPQQQQHVITSPRQWLESQPIDGAYTVIRCDYLARETGSSVAEKWKIWGLDYHLERLGQSFLCLPSSTSSKETTTSDPSQPHSLGPSEIEQVKIRSASLIHRLLDAALLQFDWQGRARVAIVTILWLPRSSQTTTAVSVQGHVCLAAAPSTDRSDSRSSSNKDDDKDSTPFLAYDPIPITVAVVAPNNNTHLPNRQPYPLAKLSSWCRERRSLEMIYMRPASIKTHSGSNEVVPVDEVILTDDSPGNNSICLLEGLTSNLFVVYPNKVIRTTENGVLHGFARHLILRLLKATIGTIGWTVDLTTPIRIDEAHDQWQDVFVTSSVRLIVPVGRVLVPLEPKMTNSANNCILSNAFRTVWSRSGTEQEHGMDPPIWKQLYQRLMQTEYNPEND